MIRDAITIALLFSGALFCLLGAVGIVRMPDLFTRLQASTKAGALGITLIMAAVGVHFAELQVTVHAVLVVAFFFLTAPIAAHMIARAAYFVKVPLWKNTTLDELEGMYDPDSHTVASPGEPRHDGSGPRLARDRQPPA
jgi:multicomponent Na+:H+ antiporter subunit G